MKENVNKFATTTEAVAEVNSESGVKELSPSTARVSDVTSDASSEGGSFKTTPESDGRCENEIILGADEDTADKRTVNDASVQLHCDDSANDDRGNVRDSTNSEENDAYSVELQNVNDEPWKGHVQLDDENVEEFVRNVDSNMAEKLQSPVKVPINSLSLLCIL